MEKENNSALTIAKPLSKRKLSKGKNRIWELDFIRGICVLLMIWDHFMFNISEIFGEAWATANPIHNEIGRASCRERV